MDDTFLILLCASMGAVAALLWSRCVLHVRSAAYAWIGFVGGALAYSLGTSKWAQSAFNRHTALGQQSAVDAVLLYLHSHLFLASVAVTIALSTALFLLQAAIGRRPPQNDENKRPAITAPSIGGADRQPEFPIGRRRRSVIAAVFGVWAIAATFIVAMGVSFPVWLRWTSLCVLILAWSFSPKVAEAPAARRGWIVAATTLIGVAALAGLVWTVLVLVDRDSFLPSYVVGLRGSAFSLTLVTFMALTAINVASTSRAR